jgi:hypothetical protein
MHSDWSRSLVLALALTGLGCSDETDEAEPALPPDPPVECGEFELRAQDDTCHAIGIPPGACGEGFVSDELGGCLAVLPSEPCPPGLIAVPGDESCREVSPCATGQWGDIPVESNTQYVDGAYSGGNSNGSAAQPWTLIADGLTAAEPGAIVAVAEGTYDEDLRIADKPVRLWGKCPALVTVSGSATFAAILVGLGADGSEIRSIGITSASNGAFSSGSLDVWFDRVWVHDMPGRGISTQDDYGPASIRVTDSLVERVAAIGLFVGGATGTFERCSVRDIAPIASGRGGIFIAVEPDPATATRAAVTISSCLLQRGQEVGINIGSSDAEVTGTVVRDVSSSPNGLYGLGMSLYEGSLGVSNVSVRTSVVERTQYLGVLVVDANATIEHTFIHDVFPRTSDNGFGDGIAVVSDQLLSTAVVSESRIAGVSRAGLSDFGGVLSLAGTSLACTAFDLDIEVYNDVASAFENLGNNVCGCETLEPCKAVSAQLQAPEAPM